MKLCSIASGSSGNCIFVASDTTKILIDAGISKKRMEEGLKEIGENPGELSAILITHEHQDHIRGLGVMSRKYHLPIYASEGTIRALHTISSIGAIEEELYCRVRADEAFRIGDLWVTPFAIFHDAAEPVAYKLRSEQKQMAVVTDLGMYDESLVKRLEGLDALLLEANHDVRMLQVGSYPYYLKQRILGKHGHLSNETSARLLCELLSGRLRQVLLGHLSLENNLEQLALETVRQEVALEAARRELPMPGIAIAGRNHPSQMIEF